jgi:hypothetical protein
MDVNGSRLSYVQEYVGVISRYLNSVGDPNPSVKFSGRL